MNKNDYKESFRKKILEQNLLIKIFDFINKGEPVSVIFVLVFISISIYVGSSFKIIYDLSLFELIFSLLLGALLILIFYFLNKQNVLKNIESFLFNIGRKKYGNIKGVISSNVLIALLLSLIFSVSVSISFEPYFLYMYAVGYIYCNIPFLYNSVESKDSGNDNFKEIDRVKLISLFYFLLSFMTYALVCQEDPLFSTSIFCFSPFLISSFFMKGIESLCFMYRTAFFILIFFISTTIFPHFFIIGLVCLWLGKFYYFIKYDLRYPTFYNHYNYDKNQ